MTLKLYHASNFNQTELMPGYRRTCLAGDCEVVKWDKTESNKFLYATSDEESAIQQGFASAIDHHYTVDKFTSSTKDILVQLQDKPLPTLQDLERLSVYLYTLDFSNEDGWIRNHNSANGLDTEWKTRKTVSSRIVSVEQIGLKRWLSPYKVKIINSKPAYAGWGKKES